jgi:hypothetical protein
VDSRASLSVARNRWLSKRLYYNSSLPTFVYIYNLLHFDLQISDILGQFLYFGALAIIRGVVTPHTTYLLTSLYWRYFVLCTLMSHLSALTISLLAMFNSISSSKLHCPCGRLAS